MRPKQKLPSIVDLTDRVVRVNEAGYRFSLAPHQQGILCLAFAFLPTCNTILFSAIKKSGKTEMTLEFAAFRWDTSYSLIPKIRPSWALA